MMKRFFVFMILIIGIMLCSYALCDEIETENAVPDFSVLSGFYPEEFDLTITSLPGWRIYYTTDSSDPDENSILYADPIRIRDATDNPNVYSMIQDVSLGLKLDEVEQIIGEPVVDSGYRLPEENIDKCTVIRAVAIKGEEKSSVVTEVYFVGFDQKKGYDRINILSIVTDPDNLFGYENGIYTLGKQWDIYKQNVNSANWSWWEGNFSFHFIESEREVVLHWFDQSRELVFSQSCGIRIQGNTSRAYNPKSLKLYARKDYKTRNFPDLFDNGYIPNKMNLFSGSQDYGTKIRDVIVNELARDMNVSTQKYIPCVMFLDGEYWGLYFLTDRYDQRWVSNIYSVPATDVVVVKNHALSEGEWDDLVKYRED